VSTPRIGNLMKTIYKERYQQLLMLLVEARKTAGLTQAQVSALLDRPQSFIAKVENGDRRLDVIEFMVLCQALGQSPENIITRIS